MKCNLRSRSQKNTKIIIQMPSRFREAIFNVVRSFPQITFMWKTDANDTAPSIPNLHTFTWLPQLSILGILKKSPRQVFIAICSPFLDHPNLLCFVSHAGLNSVLEVTRSGKPSILVPIFGDQFRLAKTVDFRKQLDNISSPFSV